MKKLIWTKKKPTEVGWYWKREFRKTWDFLSVVEVRWYGREMCVGNWAVSDTAEWAGPLEEPEDAN